jgi:capsule assembly protein Wzi/PAP2 superfamily protein
LVSCCLLAAAEMQSVNCCAKPQGQGRPEAKPDAVGGTDDQRTDLDASRNQPGASDGQAETGQVSETKLGLSLLRNIALDQEAIWTSPARLRLRDVNWLVPLAGVVAASLASDTGLSRALTHSASIASKSNTVSNYGVGALGGVTGGLYLWGKMTHDDHRRETGLLSGEAAVNAVGVTTALQYAFGRQRPTDGDGGGGFWQHGTSFPSDHSAVAWAMASVIAHEYPGPFTKLLVYGLASAVSVSRVTGKDHFPTDVLVGAGIGWLTGRHVFLAHHDPELGGGPWELPFEDDADTRKRGLPDQSAASTFVPLDDWVYPAFDRLVASGYATTALQGMKPWTRMECARLTEEVGDALVEATHEDRVPDEQVAQLHEELAREFAREIGVLGGARNQSLELESVYARAMSISGPILTEGYHLGGQTISYDFGRPFERGTNGLLGASVDASMGPVAVFARVEYQHSPSAPSLPDSVLSFISTNDRLPLQASSALSAVNRADLLEGYLSFNHDGWQVSAGKQAMSWNVGEGGAMLLSDNAEPLYMVRLTRTIPAELPGFLRFAGHFRTEMFIAKVSGGSYVPHPLLHGEKISFHVTSYLELGLARTALLGRGRNATGGDPFTTANFVSDFFAISRNTGSVAGDNRSSMDFNLDLPGLKHSASLYGDLYTDNVVTYLADPPISSYRAGMYLPRLPRLSRVDFRVESTSTMSPVYGNPYGGLTNYWGDRYRDGYTNYGELLGNTVGRRGRIFQGWTTFHISSLHQIQFSFLHHQVDPKFVPGGGLWQDYGVSHEIHARSGIYAKTMIQFEHIQHFPILFNGSPNNVTASVELGFTSVWAKR